MKGCDRNKDIEWVAPPGGLQTFANLTGTRWNRDCISGNIFAISAFLPGLRISGVSRRGPFPRGRGSAGPKTRDSQINKIRMSHAVSGS